MIADGFVGLPTLFFFFFFCKLAHLPGTIPDGKRLLRLRNMTLLFPPRKLKELSRKEVHVDIIPLLNGPLLNNKNMFNSRKKSRDVMQSVCCFAHPNNHRTLSLL